MFYFNDCVDDGEPNYPENCTFKYFTIDSTDTSPTYTSAGNSWNKAE